MGTIYLIIYYLSSIYYLANIYLSYLFRLDSKIGMEDIELDSAPTLWELSNAVARPVRIRPF